MLTELTEALKLLPELLDQRERWDSLIVNRRKPITYRVFTTLDNGLRICLHKFDPCHDHEAFKHPHPWPGAFAILKGSYRMWLGSSNPAEADAKPTDVATLTLTEGAKYEIVMPGTWHNVIPLEPTYTVMVNGQPWEKDFVHPKAPTTKGKDLDKMPEAELVLHLKKFKELVKINNNKQKELTRLNKHRAFGATGYISHYEGQETEGHSFPCYFPIDDLYDLESMQVLNETSNITVYSDDGDPLLVGTADENILLEFGFKNLPMKWNDHA